MSVLNRIKKIAVSAALVLVVAIATSGLGLLGSSPAQASPLQPVLLVGSNAAGQIEIERAKNEFKSQTSPEVQKAIEDPQGKVERDIERTQNKVERDIERTQDKVERDIDRTQDAAEDAKSGILDFFGK